MSRPTFLNKKLLVLFIGLYSFFNLHSQNNPIAWETSYKALSATEGEILVSAKINKGWHTYSQQANEAVPLPTLFSFKEEMHYELIGKMEESNAHEEFDAALGAKLLVFVDHAEFKQKVKLKTKAGQTINFKVEYISCDNKMCLPPTTIDLKIKTQ